MLTVIQPVYPTSYRMLILVAC